MEKKPSQLPEQSSEQSPPQQSSEKPEFQMRSEDFPTLLSTVPSESRPSSVISEPGGIMSGPSGIMSGPSGIMSGPSGIMNEPSRIMMPGAGISPLQVPFSFLGNPNFGFIPRPGPCFFDPQPTPRSNIQIYPDGTVTNIPPTMMTDQFGMLGFLSAYRGMNVDPNLAALAIGEDPVNMGLGMNSQLIVPDPCGRGRREIHLNYGGPWADKPNHAPHIETRIPEVYRTNLLLADKLAEIKFPMLEEDALFYIFYNFPGEQYQIAAAHELHGRDWRYHKVDRIWIRRYNYNSVIERTKTFEKGLYNVFDPIHWRKIPQQMTLQYKDLAKRPALPPAMKPFFD